MVITEKIKQSLIFDGILLLIILGFALFFKGLSFLVIAALYLVVSILNTFRLIMKEERKGLPKLDAEVDRLQKEQGEGS